MKFWLSRSEHLSTLKEALPFCEEHGMNVTVRLTDADHNREVSVRELENIEREMRDRKITPFCFLPYHGLALSCPDSRVMTYSREVLLEGLEIGTILGARVAILQTGFSNHIRPNMVQEWKERFIGAMKDLVSVAEDEEVVLALKNSFEPDTDLLLEILETVNSPWLRFCVDVGHAACFSRVSPEEWVPVFKDYLICCNFHDNTGMEDEHLACGGGYVPFDGVFETLKQLSTDVHITLDVAPELIPASVDHLTGIGFEFEKGPIAADQFLPAYDS
ncbi:MAG: sugar phosphate isomerase/epimerase [Candidatus Eisenbacteria bacterium]|uniref:Sugar phosphate isomerase/epimerase n=1 Tax=Eiseniibacteriota bacterium TaxID=2212470 RepID=A0A956RPB6_UNCEI|nr:sugar phosphate isomerase/epimerase [Candidatus Eisenbacteria bacterium]